ncbi:hypothetical protein POM88_045286 [Heracleum sosnowskyi]|uniref:Uncharacterized protein n=1 Tax=Heracleum sosnowskyi TaxID=360622 RepID=A0AAD8M607_9APIA|nr:hypothetical protein POM88_045286 [Heracleum sosnowskyi]
MQAFVYPAEWNVLQNDVHEGHTYTITNFNVRAAYGSLRPVSSPWSIIFTQYTIVQPLMVVPVAIPNHKFEFVSFGDIPQLTQSYPQFQSPTNSIGEFDTPPVLVLASVKANCHFGAIRITSLPSTKIYVNLQDASTAIMRQSRLFDQANNDAHNDP